MTERLCPNCGTSVATNLALCPKCGEHLQNPFPPSGGPALFPNSQPPSEPPAGFGPPPGSPQSPGVSPPPGYGPPQGFDPRQGPPSTGLSPPGMPLPGMPFPGGGGPNPGFGMPPGGNPQGFGPPPGFNPQDGAPDEDLPHDDPKEFEPGPRGGPGFNSPPGFDPRLGMPPPGFDPRSGMPPPGFGPQGFNPPPGFDPRMAPPGIVPPPGGMYPQQAYGYPPVMPGPPKQKAIAGILAILIGGLGVHFFYLGQKKWGLIFLLGTIFTCGFAAILTTPVSIVQGIMYLCASDEEFYHKYVVQQRMF